MASIHGPTEIQCPSSQLIDLNGVPDTIQSGRHQIPSQEKADVAEIGEPRFETELDSNLGSAFASHKGQGKS